MDSNSVVNSITIRIADERCNVDVDVLHDALLHLPANKYLELYSYMRKEVHKSIEVLE